MRKVSWANADIDFPCALLSTQDQCAMSEQQCRFKPAQSLKQRLVERVRAYTEAILLPPDAQREGLLGEARQADATAHLDQWRRKPGLESAE